MIQPSEGKTLKNGLIVTAAAIYAALAIAAAVRASGSAAITLSFLAAYGALLLLVFPKPRLYVYTCTAILLFLGFAVKFIALQLFKVTLNEPTGAFSYRAVEWDRALLAATAGAVGLIVVRLVQLGIMRRRGVHAQPVVVAPEFYVRHRAALWILATIAFLVIAVVNMTGSFYQIGLDTQMILPMRLHIIASWLIHSGFLLVTALLVAWEMSLQRSSAALAAPAVEGLLISISALSRSLFMLHVMPFALWILGHDDERPRVHVPRWYTAYASMFAISIVGVMVARANIYPPRKVLAPETVVAAKTLPRKTPAATTPATTTQVAAAPVKAATPATTAPAKTASKKKTKTATKAPAKPAQVATTTAPPPTTTATPAAPPPAKPVTKAPAPPPDTPRLVDANARQQAQFALWEVKRLVIGRWIGLEGAVAVASWKTRSPELFMYVVREDASGGTMTTYQRVAHATYQPSDRFTFLTLAGFIGVLSFSGSLLIIFAGSAGIAVVLTAIELFALRALRAPIAAGAIGVMLANAVCQMNFPYLSMVFAVQQVIAIALAGIALRLMSRRSA